VLSQKFLNRACAENEDRSQAHRPRIFSIALRRDTKSYKSPRSVQGRLKQRARENLGEIAVQSCRTRTEADPTSKIGVSFAVSTALLFGFISLDRSLIKEMLCFETFRGFTNIKFWLVAFATNQSADR